MTVGGKGVVARWSVNAKAFMMTNQLTLVLAQLSQRVGDLSANMEAIRRVRADHGDADLILWIDQPRWLRLFRIIRRTVTQLGRPRADMAEGCPERLDGAFIEFLRWVWDFDRVTRPPIEAGLERAWPGKPVLHLKGDRAIAAWLETLSP